MNKIKLDVDVISAVRLATFDLHAHELYNYFPSFKLKIVALTSVQYLLDLKTTATDLAVLNKNTYVVCGHIREPVIVRKENKNGTT